MRRRSWLFVPGDSEKKLAKIAASDADAVIIDLEDSVAPARKNRARTLTSEFLAARRNGGPECWVRINPVSSGLASADVNAVIAEALAGVLVPKPDSVRDLLALDTQLTNHEGRLGRAAGSTKMLPIISETALSMINMQGYAQPPKRVWGYTWGAEDLAADIGASRNRDATGDWTFTYKLARSMCQLAAAAAGVPAIDSIYADFRDSDGLRRYAGEGRQDGFAGMLAIHPAQVEIINTAYTPTDAEIEHARRVIAAFAAGGDTGVVGLDGKMLDRPHLRQAEEILAGLDS